MNNILPKKTDEFLSKQYWAKFFKKLKKMGGQNEFFEWYGNYQNFKKILADLIDSKEIRVLNIGCGKSLFSEDMYDDGYSNIVNMDFEEQVIQEMIARSQKIRPKMVYEVGDVYNLKYEEGSFDIVLDKGCMDAVFPNDKPEVVASVNKMLDHIQRILKQGQNSQYIIISLLQDHIIDLLMERYLLSSNRFLIEIYQEIISNSKLNPFLVSIKFIGTELAEKMDIDKKPRIIFHQQDQSVPPLFFFKAENLKRAIQNIQIQNNFMNDAKELHAGQCFNLSVWDQKDQQRDIPKYTLKICDSPNKKILEKVRIHVAASQHLKEKKMTIFIIAKRVISTFLNSKFLSKNFFIQYHYYHSNPRTNMSRLVIVLISPGFVIDSLKQVQDELADIVKEVIPQNCSNFPCPFMTDGDDLGTKLIIYDDSECVVEEYFGEQDTVFRKLILKQNLSQIQSQVKIIHANFSKSSQFQPLKKTLLPDRKGYAAKIDDSYLDSEAHRMIISGFSLINLQIFEQPDQMQILVLGGGLCCLSKFIYNTFQNIYIQTVEISENVIQVRNQQILQTALQLFQQVAQTQFDVVQTDNFQLINDEASQYLSERISKRNKKLAEAPEQKEEDQQAEGEEEEEEKEEKKEEVNPQTYLFDIIILDFNGDGAKGTPLPEFRNNEFLNKIKLNLQQGTGVLMFNAIFKADNDRKDFEDAIKKNFDMSFKCEGEDEFCELYYGINIELAKEIQQEGDKEEEIVIIDKKLIFNQKETENNFQNITKASTKRVWDPTLNFEKKISNIQLWHPKVFANPFQRTNVHVSDASDGTTVNSTKQMYQGDVGKVKKKKQNKKKR